LIFSEKFSYEEVSRMSFAEIMEAHAALLIYEDLLKKKAK